MLAVVLSLPVVGVAALVGLVVAAFRRDSASRPHHRTPAEAARRGAGARGRGALDRLSNQRVRGAGVLGRMTRRTLAAGNTPSRAPPARSERPRHPSSRPRPARSRRSSAARLGALTPARRCLRDGGGRRTRPGPREGRRPARRLGRLERERARQRAARRPFSPAPSRRRAAISRGCPFAAWVRSSARGRSRLAMPALLSTPRVSSKSTRRHACALRRGPERGRASEPRRPAGPSPGASLSDCSWAACPGSTRFHMRFGATSRAPCTSPSSCSSNGTARSRGKRPYCGTPKRWCSRSRRRSPRSHAPSPRRPEARRSPPFPRDRARSLQALRRDQRRDRSRRNRTRTADFRLLVDRVEPALARFDKPVFFASTRSLRQLLRGRRRAILASRSASSSTQAGSSLQRATASSSIRSSNAAVSSPSAPNAAPPVGASTRSPLLPRRARGGHAPVGRQRSRRRSPDPPRHRSEEDQRRHSRAVGALAPTDSTRRSRACRSRPS